MSIRSRVVLSCLFFVLLAGGVGSFCYRNAQKEETAYLKSRDAFRVQNMVSDIEYFLNRQSRALQNYILLNDEAEKLQMEQTASVLKDKIGTWRNWVSSHQAAPDEYNRVKKILEDMQAAGKIAVDFLEAGSKAEAMAHIDGVYVPLSTKSLSTDLKAVKDRTALSAQTAEEAMQRQIQLNYVAVMGGLAAVVVFGLIFLVSTYKYIIVPVRIITGWADKVAKGEDAPLPHPRRDELSRMAEALLHMAQELTRRVAQLAASQPQPVPPRPPVDEGFENAVKDFRSILSKMTGPRKG